MINILERNPVTGELTPSIHTLSIDVFKKILETYGDKGVLMLSQIWYLEDVDSPFFNYPEEDKELKVKEQILKDSTFKETKLLSEGRKIYKEMILTPSMRLFISAKKAMFKLEKFLGDVDLTSISNPKILVDTLKSIKPIVEGQVILEEQVTKDKQNKGRSKGDVRGGSYED